MGTSDGPRAVQTAEGLRQRRRRRRTGPGGQRFGGDKRMGEFVGEYGVGGRSVAVVRTRRVLGRPGTGVPPEVRGQRGPGAGVGAGCGQSVGFPDNGAAGRGRVRLGGVDHAHRHRGRLRHQDGRQEEGLEKGRPREYGSGSPVIDVPH